MRIIGLDAARSLAIVLAMSSHVFADVGLYAHMPGPLTRIAGFAFQIATPTFILLFGTMLEVVYRPRWTTRQARHGVAMRPAHVPCESSPRLRAQCTRKLGAAAKRGEKKASRRSPRVVDYWIQPFSLK